MDHENTIKAYAASPSMLGRGHTLLEPLGPVWVRDVYLRRRNAWAHLPHTIKCVDASDYHPQLAVAAADGTCSTSNMLRSPRRGGSVVSPQAAGDLACAQPSSSLSHFLFISSIRWTTAASRRSTECWTVSYPR